MVIEGIYLPNISLCNLTIRQQFQVRCLWTPEDGCPYYGNSGQHFSSVLRADGNKIRAVLTVIVFRDTVLFSGFWFHCGYCFLARV